MTLGSVSIVYFRFWSYCVCSPRLLLLLQLLVVVVVATVFVVVVVIFAAVAMAVGSCYSLSFSLKHLEVLVLATCS